MVNVFPSSPFSQGPSLFTQPAAQQLPGWRGDQLERRRLYPVTDVHSFVGLSAQTSVYTWLLPLSYMINAAQPKVRVTWFYLPTRKYRFWAQNRQLKEARHFRILLQSRRVKRKAFMRNRSVKNIKLKAWRERGISSSGLEDFLHWSFALWMEKM